jgi:hypothetical protein
MVTAGWQAFMGNFFSLCPGLFAPARHAGMSQNVGVDKLLAPAKISLIFAKLQQ